VSVAVARRNTGRVARAVLRNVVAWLLVGLIVFPLFWMVSSSLKPRQELFATPPTLIPRQPTLDNFATLLRETPFLTYFGNSLIVACATTALVILVALLGAYSVVRFRFRGRRLASKLILFTYLLPQVVLLLPIYLVLAKLRLTNSLAGLVIAYTSFALPFSLWMLRSFLASIPIELEEAAMIDGASRLVAFWRIVVPQALPGIISTALFSFILSWNEYLYALVFINRDAMKTLPPGVMTMLQQNQNVEWALLMAASVLMSLPILVCFSFLQSHLTRGMGAGGVKG
jgi:multiple sugar transport system permease protein